jgi:AcrR family transcriptional regulator
MIIASNVDDDPRRDTVLRIARRSFTADGYAVTRMEPIAREAGVSTATLYALFPSKEHLFAAVIERAADDFAERMSRVRDEAQGDARQQLVRFMSGYAGFMGDPFIRSIFRLVMAERARFPKLALHFFERGRSDFGGVLMQALQRLCAAGELVVPKPSWAAGQLMGMIEHPVFFMPIVTGDERIAMRGHDQIVEDAVETFLARYGVR